MKNVILAAAIVTASTLGTARHAHATGIPVVDVASALQRAIEHGLSMAEYALQLKELIKQYEQMKDSYDAVTGIRNLGDVFDSPTLRQYLPDDWLDTYDLVNSGYSALSGDALDLYGKYKIYDACDRHTDTERREHCEIVAVRGALNKAQHLRTALLISDRAEQVRDLQKEINQTSDPKAIAELQARISIEQAAIANESARLEVQERTLEADKQMLEQRELEFNARAFSATDGVVIAPLSF